MGRSVKPEVEAFFLDLVEKKQLVLYEDGRVYNNRLGRFVAPYSETAKLPPSVLWIEKRVTWRIGLAYLMWRVFKGPIPPRHHVFTIKKGPPSVDNIQLVSMAQAYLKEGLNPLTDELLAEAKRDYEKNPSLTMRELATRHNVSYYAFRRAFRGQTYKSSGAAIPLMSNEERRKTAAKKIHSELKGDKPLSEEAEKRKQELCSGPWAMIENLVKDAVDEENVIRMVRSKYPISPPTIRKMIQRVSEGSASP